MRKTAVFFLCALLLAGCGQPGEPQTETGSSVEVVLLDPAEAESKLTSEGWDVQNTSASSFHLWEQYKPDMLLLAENKQDQVFIGGKFPDAETALSAYESIVPLSDDSSLKNQDSDWYRQSLVTLPDSQGMWIFRQEGPYVLGGWIAEESQQTSMTNTFASLQVSPEPELAPEEKEAITGDGPRTPSNPQEGSEDQSGS